MTACCAGDSTSGLQEDYKDFVLPSPPPLEGVKSRKRQIFQATSVSSKVQNGIVPAHGLSLSLESRVIAVGIAGQVAVRLLVHQQNEESEQLSRHKGLTVLQIQPSEISAEAAAEVGYYKAVLALVAQKRPHVLVVDEALHLENASWREAFLNLVTSEEFRRFRGAIVFCCDAESVNLHQLCSERWVLANTVVRQQPCFDVTLDMLTCSRDQLFDEIEKIDYCDLRYWIDRAESEGWTVTRFGATGCLNEPCSLRGLIFHNMVPGYAEFNVRFIFVPKAHRCRGLGGQLVQWVIEKARQMPPSECRWISLEAADDELVAWYEKFGFTDMSCGHTDGDYGQTRMEMQNVSLVPECQ